MEKYQKNNMKTTDDYDDGNIPKEDLPYIFERFFKSDKSRGLDKTGVGLGMFITKTIMEAHSESISVDSEYGKWCRFSFTLKQAERAFKYKNQERRTI